MSAVIRATAISLCITSAFYLFTDSRSLANVPQQVHEKAVEAYLNCGKENGSRNFEAADTACQTAANLLAPYECRLQIGVYSLWSNVKLNKSDFKSAEDLADKAVSVAIKVTGQGSLEHSLAMRGKAESHLRQGKYDQAKPIYSEAVQMFESLLEKYPNLQSQQDFGSTYRCSLDGLLFCFASERNDEDALAVAGKIAKANNRSPSDYQKNLVLAGAYAQVGGRFAKSKHDKKAQPYLEKSVALYRQYQDKNPEVPVGAKQLTVPYPSIQSAMQQLGEIYERSGKVQEGKKLLGEVKQWRAVDKSFPRSK